MGEKNKHFRKYLIIALLTGFVIISIAFILKQTLTNIYLIKSGNISEKEFVKEVQFEEVLGLMVLPVEIEGETYRFLFDTGATSVISSDLFHKLNLKKKSSINANDSQGNSSELILTQIPVIGIGNIQYKNIGAAVMEFEGIVSCLEIDGIIGNNLMRLVHWKIDNDNRRIIFSDDLQNLITEEYKAINFKTPFLTAEPKVDLSLGAKKTISLLLDTGFNSEISLGENFPPESMKNDKLISVGEVASGVLGANQKISETVTDIRTDLYIQDFIISPSVVFYNSTQKYLLGNQLLKKYNYILDWQNNKIYLQRNNSKETAEVRGFGFGYDFIDNKVEITQIILETPGDHNLKIGDQIINFNNEDWSQMDFDRWCEIRRKSIHDSVNLTIKRDSEILSFSFKEELLLPKKNQ